LGPISFSTRRRRTRASAPRCRSPYGACARRWRGVIRSLGISSFCVSASRARRASAILNVKVERVRASKLRTHGIARCAGPSHLRYATRTESKSDATFSCANYCPPLRAHRMHTADTNAQIGRGRPVAIATVSALADGEWVGKATRRLFGARTPVSEAQPELIAGATAFDSAERPAPSVREL